MYLLSPYSRKKAHHTSHNSPESHSAHAPATNDHEVEPAAVQEEERSLGDDQLSSGGASLADDEGAEVSAEELNASIEQAFTADSPKDAQSAEAKSLNDPPSDSDNVELKKSRDDSETPSPTTQSQEDKETGPTDTGKARAAAKEKAAEDREQKS